MADPLVELETTRLQVNPGGQVSVRVAVRNVGHIIEGFRLDVLGTGISGWAEVSPPELRIDVGQEASAVVIFTPPTGSAAPDGSLPFAVRARSLVDSSSSAVAEGDIEVGRVFGLTSKILPVTSTGRLRGQHRVEFTNWGNSPVHLRMAASDPDERLGFLVAPESLLVPLGGSAQARVKVRTRKPFLRGKPARVPFQVVAEPFGPGAGSAGAGGPNSQRQVLDGALLQKPVIGRWVVVTATLAIVALVAAIALATLNKGKGGGAAAATPDAPANLTIDDTLSDLMTLSWDPVVGASTYTILVLDGKSAHPTSQVAGVDGHLGGAPVPKLLPATPYCFEIVTVAGGLESPPSEKACGRTRAAADPTIAAPAGFAATPTSDTSITVSWQTDTDADAFQLLSVSPDGASVTAVQPVTSNQINTLPIGELMPATQYCFQIQALKGGVPGSRSPVACATTGTSVSTSPPTTPVSTGPTGGETPEPGDWLVVVKTQQVSLGIPNAEVTDLRENPIFAQAGYVVDPTNPLVYDVYVTFGADGVAMQTTCLNEVQPLFPEMVCAQGSDIIQIPPS